MKTMKEKMEERGVTGIIEKTTYIIGYVVGYTFNYIKLKMNG